MSKSKNRNQPQDQGQAQTQLQPKGEATDSESTAPAKAAESTSGEETEANGAQVTDGGDVTTEPKKDEGSGETSKAAAPAEDDEKPRKGGSRSLARKAHDERAAQVSKSGRVKCKVVGPGSVHSGGRRYRQGSVAEFSRLDAERMAQLQPVK